MLNHGTGINRISSKLSPRTVITIYEERGSRARPCHACSASGRAAAAASRTVIERREDYRLIIPMYSDGIDDDESGIGNLLLVAVMSCIDPSAVQTAPPVFDVQNHVCAHEHLDYALTYTRARTHARIHAGIKYVSERRPVFVDKIAGS